MIGQQMENLRQAIKDGWNDIQWANEELTRLDTERSRLLERLQELAPSPKPALVDLSLVEECRKAFAEVFAVGTSGERRQMARLFVKRIEVNPDSGDILMHLFARPPAQAKRRTPASKKTGVAIGMVAGAGFEPATFGL